MARYNTIEINEKEYPISFTMSVLFAFCREKGIKFDEFAANAAEYLNDPDSLELLVYLGLVQGHKAAGQNIEIEKTEIFEVEFATYNKYLQLITVAFNGDGGNPEGAIEEGNGKKKVQKKQ